MSRLINHFPDYMTGGGIFANLSDMPWDGDETIDKVLLDIEYFGNHSGLKASSPLLEKMTCLPDEHYLTQVEIDRLCGIIRQKFGLSWAKMWEAIKTPYKPLENYSMLEVSTPRVTRKTAQATDTTADTGTDVDRYGFNSTNPVGDSKEHTVLRQTGDKTKNYTEQSSTGEDTLTRSGNIGVTTSQQMLQSELELRKTHYFELIYNDVDTILTSPIWEEC